MITSLMVAAAMCCVVGFVFVAVETALAHVSRGSAEEWNKEGRRGGAALETILADAPGYLSVTTFVRVGAETAVAVCCTVLAIYWVEDLRVVVLVTVAVLAVVMFVVFGVSPRTLGRQHASVIALSAAPSVVWLRRILGPFARLLVAIANAVTPGKGYRDGPFESEAELRHLVDAAGDSLVIEDEEREMIHSVFELGHTIAREVMVPRTDMQVVDSTTSLQTSMARFVASGHSRLPVIGEDADDPVGLLYFKDVARRLHQLPGTSEEPVTTVMRPVPFIPESKPVDGLLREMQRDHTHLAIVIDEYGGTAGLITIEDILEEIVGEIADEHDRKAPELEILDSCTARVPASMSVDDFADLLDIEVHTEDVDTVGGLIAQISGQVPTQGTTVDVDGAVLTAERMDSRRQRIATVLVRSAEPVFDVAPTTAPNPSPPPHQ